MGRAGTGYRSYVLMLEEVARVFHGHVPAAGGANSAVQAPGCCLFGTDARRKNIWRRMATGETLERFA